MEASFSRLIEQVPQDVYTGAKALISEKVAVFKPNTYIINKKMCTEDYNFILPASTPPPAKIGKQEYRFRKDCLIAIGSEVDYLCTTNAPTREYINIVIKKDFFEEIASNITGKRKVDFSKVEYARSRQLLRIIAEYENELTCYKSNYPLMIQSIATQMIIQLLRDTGSYTRTGGKELYKDISYTEFLSDDARLTPREIEITAYLLERYDYDTIAGKLFISPNTLKTHVKNIYKKLRVSSRKELSLKVNDLITLR